MNCASLGVVEDYFKQLVVEKFYFSHEDFGGGTKTKVKKAAKSCAASG